jgi:hypothetical protein
MTIVNCRVAVNAVGVPESVIVKVGVKVPEQEAEIVPLITPAEVMVRHAGREPVVTVHV